MTLDELFEKYYEAWSAVARQTDGDMQSAGRAGIRAVVVALRDAMCGNIKSNQSAAEAWAIFEEILGDAGEKVAGDGKADGTGSFVGERDPKAPATDAAPAVCVWTPEEYVTHSTSCESEHEVDPHKAPPMYCPSCGKPIIFKEPSHE